MRDYKGIFARRLTAARVIIRKKTQQEIENETGISTYRQGRFENGQSEACITEAILLANALDVPILWLIGTLDATEGSGYDKAEKMAGKIMAQKAEKSRCIRKGWEKRLHK